MMIAEVESIENLREFSFYLRNLSGSMRAEFEYARKKMYEVNKGWKDVQNAKFMEEFEQSVELISRIADHMEDYSLFINKKCDILDQYNAN